MHDISQMTWKNYAKDLLLYKIFLFDHLQVPADAIPVMVISPLKWPKRHNIYYFTYIHCTYGY